MNQAPTGRSRWLIPAVALVFLTAAVIGYGLWVGSAIPRGTAVNGISVGGMQPAAAQRALTLGLSGRMAPITVTAEGKTATIRPLNSGISVEVAQTIEQLPRREFQPLWLVSHLLGGRSHKVIVAVDQDRLANALSPLSRQVTTPAVEGSITFKGTVPLAQSPSPGTALDLDRLAADISDQWLNGRGEFAASVVPAEPQVSTDEVQRVLTTIAEPAVREPLILIVDGTPITVSPRAIAAGLEFVPNGRGQLEPRLVTPSFTQAIGQSWADRVVPPISADFKVISGKVTVIPSIRGRDVPADQLQAAVIPALTKTGGDRTATVFTTEVDPPLTTQSAVDLDLRERIGYFRTQFPWTSYRAHNIHRAADILNGTIVEAGEIFSLNGTLGQRTAANGFVEGVVISGGRLSKDFGGGVSQVATTTWNAAWFAGLELLQHKPHSFYISRYPVGRESTVSWPSVDVKFRNDTGKPILITTDYYSNYISISIYGTRKYDVETITGPRYNPTTFDSYEDDSKTCINQDGIAGFTIEVTRILKQDGIEVGRKVYRTRYLSEDRVRCTNPEATFGNAPTPTVKPKPKPKPSPTETATPTPTETATPTPTSGP